MRRLIFLGVSVLAISLCTATGALADTLPSGTVSFTDFGTPLANGSPSGNINTATMFTIGDFTSLRSTGVFLGLPPLTSFGPVSFDTTVGTSLTFGNSLFGTFTSTSITRSSTAAGFADISVVGRWTPGTLGGVTGGPFLADLRIAFTQTPANTGIIGDNATFSTPPSFIPEPASWVLGITGLAPGVLYQLRRRWTKIVS